MLSISSKIVEILLNFAGVFASRHNLTFLLFTQITSFFRYKISFSFCVICFVSNSFFSYVSSIDFFNTRMFSSSLLILLCAHFKCSSNTFSLSQICLSNVSCMTLVSLACSSTFYNCSFSALFLFLDFFNSSNALINSPSQSISTFCSSSDLQISFVLLDLSFASNLDE